ncbi:hypothetical protein Peur_048405 [Populus x canadensis]
MSLAIYSLVILTATGLTLSGHVHVSVSMTVANRNCCNRKRLGTLQQKTVTGKDS